MVFISVTRLRVQAIRYLPSFVWRTLQSVRQTERAFGFLGGKLLRETRNAFWTVTAWEDEAVMNAFRTSGAHRRAMPKLLQWCDEAAVVHWTQETAELPAWREAHRRMVEEGRISKVNHPSSDQLAKHIPAPRLSRIEKSLKPAKSRQDSTHL
jgi:heme-degrading monooxygenase HmoA